MKNPGCGCGAWAGESNILLIAGQDNTGSSLPAGGPDVGSFEDRFLFRFAVDSRQFHFFKKNGDQWTAMSALLNAKPTPISQGIRLGNFVQIREAIEAELENIFGGKKTAQEGLEAAVAKGNDILKEFAAANKP